MVTEELYELVQAEPQFDVVEVSRVVSLRLSLVVVANFVTLSTPPTD